MFVVVSISLLALILTLLESRKMLKKGMTIGFILVTVLGCIHYDYGNDYMAYYDMYKTIVSIKFNLIDVISGEVHKEPLWALLCYLSKPFGGFFMMVAVLNIIQNVLVYKIIKYNVELKWWPLAVLIYLFSASYYVLNFSMMRQGLVICIFLGVWPWIRDRKWLRTVLILLLCSAIHMSALILLPFAFWGFVPIKKGWVAVLVYVGFYCLIWTSGEFMNNTLSLFLSFDGFEEYLISYGKDKANNTYGMGFVMNMIPFILSLAYIVAERPSKSDKLVVALSIISFMIAPFSEIIPLVGRVGMYFGVYQIVAVPKIYSSVRNKYVALVLLCIFILMTMYGYFGFFSSNIFRESYATFHTIFSVM